MAARSASTKTVRDAFKLQFGEKFSQAARCAPDSLNVRKRVRRACVSVPLPVPVTLCTSGK
jgi:hypothetical protein